MGILSWLIVGALAGWIASMITGDNAKMGALANIAVGIVGGLIGGFIAQSVFNLGPLTGINIYSILVAIAGAVILLLIIGFFNKRK